MVANLSQSSQFNNDILDLVPCCIFWKDKESVFLGCNLLFAKTVGLTSPKDIVGKTDYDLPWTKDESDRYRKDDAIIIRTGQSRLNIEEVQTLKNGKKLSLITNKVPYYAKDGKTIIGVIGVYQDVTHLKEALKKSELANRIRENFIENMQHDLRTPAYGVSSSLEALVEMETDLEKKKRLMLIYKSAKQLHNLCLEVTDFDRLDHREKTVINKKFNIKNLIKDVIELNQSAAFKKGLLLEYIMHEKIPNVVKGDDYRVKRILINLIGNAIKFTPEGKISLSVHLLSRTSKKINLSFEIVDTGIGIPQDKKDFIYEKFTRGTPANQNIYKGSGLGLPLVKRFVDDLGGDIDVKSNSPAGTTFRIDLAFDLPLSDEIIGEQGSYEEVAFIDSENTEKLKLSTQDEPQVVTSSVKRPDDLILALLVEDDILAGIAGQSILSSLNCEVVLAGSVSKAKDILNKTKFDVIVADIGLPDGTGFDIARFVKENPESINYNTPLFALTAHSGKEKIKAAERAGFMYLLTKPLIPKIFQGFLDNHVTKKPSIKYPQMASKKSIDLDFSIKKGFSKEDALMLIGSLCKELPRDIEMVKEAFAHNDKKELRKLFHKFKGGFSYIGVPALQQATDKMHEEIKKIKSVIAIKNLFDDFYQEAEKVLQEYDGLKS